VAKPDPTRKSVMGEGGEGFGESGVPAQGQKYALPKGFYSRPQKSFGGIQIVKRNASTHGSTRKPKKKTTTWGTLHKDSGGQPIKGKKKSLGKNETWRLR